MSFLEGDGMLLGVNMKKNGSMILQIEIQDDLEHKEDYYLLRKMIQKNLRFVLDSRVVTYKVQINARTEKPITEYKVDASGVVSEVKPSGEQLEMNLENVPADKVRIVEEKLEIDIDVINDFILSGLAPVYEDMVFDFIEITKRLLDGEAYVTLAKEQSMATEVFVLMVDEYRIRVAPLAQKWDEWRTGKIKPEPTPKAQEDNNASSDEEEEEEDVEAGDTDHEQPEEKDQGDDLPDWMKDTEGDAAATGQVEGGEIPVVSGEPEGSSAADEDQVDEIDNKKLEAYILEKGPRYDDINFDFAELLYEKKQLNLTWTEVANRRHIATSQLQAEYRRFKERVKADMKENGGAA